MADNLFGIIMWFLVPGIFLVVGIALSIKGGKSLYKALFGYITTHATCVRVDEMPDEEGGRIMYRPEYEYIHEGQCMYASRLKYSYENSVQVGTVENITVEKKYPDLIVESKESAIVGGILLFMGLNFFFSALTAMVPLIMMLIVGEF